MHRPQAIKVATFSNSDAHLENDMKCPTEARLRDQAIRTATVVNRNIAMPMDA
jgi:hypothetical protein